MTGQLPPDCGPEVTRLGWCGNSPANPYLAEAWFAKARLDRGACPCCGTGLAGDRVVIGETVGLCPPCGQPSHAPGDPHRERLLRALADAPEHCPR